jgi:hypothetical protein
MANDPLPFCRAALVSVFRAPLISRGLYAEKETKRDDSPSRDIWVRSGRVGIEPGGREGQGLGETVGDVEVLILYDILLVDEIEYVGFLVGLADRVRDTVRLDE